MPYDFKSKEKHLYLPKTTPSVIDVPGMIYITVRGKGDPNGVEFQNAVELLYALAYSIKMTHKDVLEYVVPPLEGIWWAGCDIADKSRYEWTIMLRQPDFVTADIFKTAKAAVEKKKKIDVSGVRLESFAEGLCVQVMHIGAYKDEPAAIQALEKFAAGQGYVFDIADDSVKALSRRHHEIYIGDPRKNAPDKLKTVLRYPVRKMAD